MKEGENPTLEKIFGRVMYITAFFEKSKKANASNHLLLLNK